MVPRRRPRTRERLDHAMSMIDYDARLVTPGVVLADTRPLCLIMATADPDLAGSRYLEPLGEPFSDSYGLAVANGARQSIPATAEPPELEVRSAQQREHDSERQCDDVEHQPEDQCDYAENGRKHGYPLPSWWILTINGR